MTPYVRSTVLYVRLLTLEALGNRTAQTPRIVGPDCGRRRVRLSRGAVSRGRRGGHARPRRRGRRGVLESASAGAASHAEHREVQGGQCYGVFTGVCNDKLLYTRSLIIMLTIGIWTTG